MTTSGCLGAALLSVWAAAAAAGSVAVSVAGLPDDRGRVLCTLHADAAGFPGSDGIAHARVAPTGGQALCRFDGVAPGRYAVAVLHDANDNGRLDVNAFGIPQEGWGISVGPAPRFRAPRFDEAAFDLGQAPVALTVTLR